MRNKRTSSVGSEVKKELLDYNTFSSTGPEHFTPSHSMPLRSVVYHIFKTNVGAGVFLLPTFYQETGSVLGGLVVLILGYAVVDCSIFLIEVKQKINDKFVSSYPAVVQCILGSAWKTYTNFALAFTQFGFCVMYLQYSASMIAAITNQGENEQWFILLCTVIVTPLTFLTHRMELLAHGSLIAGLCVIVALVGSALFAADTLVKKGVSDSSASFVWTPRILLFISGYLFSLEGIGVVLPIENCLSPTDKSKYTMFLKGTLYCIIGIYFCFGVVGYLAYGNDLTTSVILALPKGISKKLLEFLIATSLILSFPVQYVPAIHLIDSAFGISLSSNKRNTALLIRIAINAFLALIAGIFGSDALNMVASFIGAFGGVHLMITIPTLMHILVDRALENKGIASSKGVFHSVFVETCKNKKYKEFLYLLFTVLVWAGGVFYTCLAVFNSRKSVHVEPINLVNTSDIYSYSNLTGPT